MWVHQATHGSACLTALVSAVQALAIVLGVGQAVKDWYVIGYASGAYGAMVLA